LFRRHRVADIIVIAVIITMATIINVGGLASTTSSWASGSVPPTMASGSPTIGKEATPISPGPRQAVATPSIDRKELGNNRAI